MGGSGLGAEGRASNRRQDVTDKLFSSGREQSKKQEQVPPIGPTPTGHAQSIKGGKCNDCDTLFSLPRAKSLALSHVYDTHTHNNRPSNSIIHKHNDCPLHAYLLARRVRLALVQVYRLVCGHSARARVCVCRDHGRLGQDLVQARAQEAVVEPAFVGVWPRMDVALHLHGLRLAPHLPPGACLVALLAARPVLWPIGTQLCLDPTVFRHAAVWCRDRVHWRHVGRDCRHGMAVCRARHVGRRAHGAVFGMGQLCEHVDVVHLEEQQGVQEQEAGG